MHNKIMIVDDSILARHEIESFLADTVFEVVGHCRTGEQALELFEELKPDIVIMDILMPGIDGIETSHILLERHPEAGLIIVSSLAYDETLKKVEALGPIPFVFKPIKKSFFIDSLLKVVDSISAKERAEAVQAEEGKAEACKAEDGEIKVDDGGKEDAGQIEE